MDVQALPAPTDAQLRHLANLANGRGCPAVVANVLERIAAGRRVTGHDVHYVTRSREDARNFYARLRAAGLDILPAPIRPCEESAIELHGDVRVSLVRAAGELAEVIDDNAARMSTAELAYGHELGWH